MDYFSFSEMSHFRPVKQLKFFFGISLFFSQDENKFGSAIWLLFGKKTLKKSLWYGPSVGKLVG